MILGKSGSGKTRTIERLISEKIKAGEKRLLFLVPEQFSFETERAMLRALGPRDARRVEVMSFTRLCDLVFRSVGGISKRKLDDGGRGVFMSLAFDAVKDELILYRGKAESIEMVSLMLSCMKELKACGVSPVDLEEAAIKVKDENLSQKLRETSLLFSAFEALIKQSYIDPLDDLTRLKSTLQKTPFFKGYSVFIDSFNGFTGQELGVLEELLTQAEDVTIALCTDGLGDTSDRMSLFSSVEKTRRRLTRIARERGVKIAAPVVLRPGARFQNEELKAIEAGAYQAEVVVFDEGTEHVALYNAGDRYDEAEFVARTIRRMVMEEGRRYRDFAVISRTVEPYLGILDTALQKYEIPYFMDDPVRVDAKPLMNLLLTAFDVVHQGFRSDDIMRYLKTELAGLSAEETAELENYVLLWGVTGKRWFSPFTQHPEGFSREMTDKDKEYLQTLNRLRERVVHPLIAFHKGIKDKTGEQMAKACYLLLMDLHADEHLKELCKRLCDMGEPALSEEQLRLWDILMELLDQMALVLGDKSMSSKRFYELLRLMINARDIAFIPQGLDEVTVGDGERTRVTSPKVVFLIGAAEGEFPKNASPPGIFSDSERRALISMDLPVSDPTEDLAVEERFLAYEALTSASERLFVSWPNTGGGNDGAKAPSSLVREVKKVLRKIDVLGDERFGPYAENIGDLVWAERPAFELTARLWNSGFAFSEQLKRYFEGRPDYTGKMKGLRRAAERREFMFERPEKAGQMFSGNMKVSASQIEKYYLCRFQYFCKYGVRAKERKPAAFDALEYGSLMHYLFEHILAEFSLGGRDGFPSREAVRKSVHRLMDEYVIGQLGGWEDKSPRFKALMARFTSTAQLLLNHLFLELSQSAFTPEAFELSIGEDGEVPPLILTLPDGGKVTVEGKVDRVDVMPAERGDYIRVIDYKTGVKEFRLSDILYGLNIQMLLYLLAICKNGVKDKKDLLPAGVLYMPSNRPVVDGERDITDDKLEKEQNKKLRMNGIILDNMQVIEGMEERGEGVFIPVTLKNGAPSKTDSLVTTAQIGLINKRIEQLVVEMADALHKGEIGAQPAGGEYDACAWCPYFSVCGHEKGEPKRQILKLDRESVLKELGAGEKGGEAL